MADVDAGSRLSGWRARPAVRVGRTARRKCRAWAVGPWRRFQALEARRPLFSKPWKTGAVAALALGLAAPAGARVFRLFGGTAGPGGGTADPPGWTTLHRAELEINGGRAALTVLGVTLPPAEALETLRAAFAQAGGRTALAMGERLGWGVAFIGDRVVRVLVVALEGPRECVVFRLEQGRAEFERSQRGAEARPADATAPGARTRRLVSDRTNRIEARSIESPAGPAETAAAIERALIAEGWRPALPGADSAGAYLRGGDVCVVRVVAAEGPGGGARALIVRRRLED